MTKSNKSIKLSEVLNAIRVIKRYVDIKEKINELLAGLASAGVDITKVNFNNPMSLVAALSKARQRGVDIDIDTVFEEVEEGFDVTLEEVDEAVKVLSRFAMVSRRVDNALRVFSRSAKTSVDDLEAMARMLGLKVPSSSTEVVEEKEEEFTEEDIRDMKEVIRKYKAGEI